MDNGFAHKVYRTEWFTVGTGSFIFARNLAFLFTKPFTPSTEVLRQKYIQQIRETFIKKE
jgi:hypothetical protein